MRAILKFYFYKRFSPVWSFCATFSAKRLPPVALITRASLAFYVYTLFYSCSLESSMLPITPYWGHETCYTEKRKVLVHVQRKKSKQVPKKKTKAKFLEDKKKTLINSGKETCILVPVLLPRLHLLIFPISTNASWSLIRRTWLILYHCFGIPAEIISLAVNASAAMISMAGGIFCWQACIS